MQFLSDYRLWLGMVLFLAGIFFLTRFFADTMTTLQWQPSKVTALVMMVVLIFAFDFVNIWLMDKSAGLSNAPMTFMLIIMNLLVIVMVALVMLRFPPHVVFPLWTGLGIFTPLLISYMNGHPIHLHQVVAIGFAVVMVICMFYKDFVSSFKFFSS